MFHNSCRIDNTWEKKLLTHCDNHDYGSYLTFDEATEACDADSNCAAVYDGQCDNDGFKLCPAGFTEKSSKHSCLYTKPPGTSFGNAISIITP